MGDDIILCQPDLKKGCSVCCGLFNHKDISYSNLLKKLTLFTEFSSHAIVSSEHLLKTNDEPVRDIGAHICPFQGFILSDKPGCMMHPKINKNDLRDSSLFGRKICDTFLCPAHEILSEEEKRVLIENTNNWYLYSIAIIDPFSFQWILNLLLRELHFASGENRFKENLEKALLVHGKFLAEYEGSLFFYSISEYREGSKDFSLKFHNEKSLEEQRELKIFL